jgi:hypothetical protein
MKYITLSSVFFLTACASNPASRQLTSLQYDKVLNLGIGVSNESDVVKALGVPTNRNEKNGYYTLNYVDQTTGFQRLSVNFLSAGGKLSGILWIPRQDEKESTLVEAKAGFKQANFKEIRNEDSNPHFISGVISIVDEKSGVTIRYDQRAKMVEAIARYDVSSRVPATTDGKNKAPYTFGDESTISR